MLDAGFSRADADSWANGWAGRPEPALVLAEAVAFDDHGIPLTEALAWHGLGFESYEAIALYDARWKPAESARVRDRLFDIADLDEWVATGLPASRVLAYLRAGVSCHEHDAFEGPDKDTDSMLAALGALLR